MMPLDRKYNKVSTLRQPSVLYFNARGLLVNKTDLKALYISGTYCHTPRQSTIHVGTNNLNDNLTFVKELFEIQLFGVGTI